MTVDFTSDFSWTDDNVIIWDGRTISLSYCVGTGPNTPTITGYKAAVIETTQMAASLFPTRQSRKGMSGQTTRSSAATEMLP